MALKKGGAGCGTKMEGGKKKKGGSDCSARIEGGMGNSTQFAPYQNGGKKKRPLTEYTKFVKKEYRVLQKQNPKLKATEIISMVAKKWKEIKKK